MDEPSMESFLIGRKPEKNKKAAEARESNTREGAKTALLVILMLAVGYLLYDGYSYQQMNQATLAQMAAQIQALENLNKAGEAKISNLEGELDQTQKAVGTTKAELKKTAQQLQIEAEQAKSELSEALATKAESSDVEAFRQEAESKIVEVSSAVGGVRSEVGNVKTDLSGTKRDLEGTQRELRDVRETLSTAVAKNAEELALLRRKGEREYVEFTIPKKNQLVKVEDIRLILKNTDAKKGKYTIQVLVDDSRLEKKDRTINEPVQFLVGRDRLRYEIVVNWVEKNRAGGYLSIPKDRALAAERTISN